MNIQEKNKSSSLRNLLLSVFSA